MLCGIYTPWASWFLAQLHHVYLNRKLQLVIASSIRSFCTSMWKRAMVDQIVICLYWPSFTVYFLLFLQLLLSRLNFWMVMWDSLHFCSNWKFCFIIHIKTDNFLHLVGRKKGKDTNHFLCILHKLPFILKSDNLVSYFIQYPHEKN